MWPRQWSLMRTDAKDPMALNWSPYIERIIKEFENLRTLWAAGSQRDDSAVSHGCCDSLQSWARLCPPAAGDSLVAGGGAEPCLAQCQWVTRRCCSAAGCAAVPCVTVSPVPRPSPREAGAGRCVCPALGGCAGCAGARRDRSSRPPGPPPPLKRRVRDSAGPAAASACGARAAPARAARAGPGPLAGSCWQPSARSEDTQRSLPVAPTALLLLLASLGPQPLLSGKSQKRGASPGRWLQRVLNMLVFGCSLLGFSWPLQAVASDPPTFCLLLVHPHSTFLGLPAAELGLCKVTSLGYSSGSLRAALPARHLVRHPCYPICCCPACSFKDDFALTVFAFSWIFFHLFLLAASMILLFTKFCGLFSSKQQHFPAVLRVLGQGSSLSSVLSCSCAFSARWVTQRVQNKSSACLWTVLSEDTGVSPAFFRLPQHKLLGAVFQLSSPGCYSNPSALWIPVLSGSCLFGSKEPGDGQDVLTGRVQVIVQVRQLNVALKKWETRQEVVFATAQPGPATTCSS